MTACSKLYNGLSTKEQHDSLNQDKLFFLQKNKECYSLVCYTEGYGMSGSSVCLFVCLSVLMPMSSSDGKRK